MSVDFQLTAQVRADVGTGASRRLRRQGLVPAVIYGAGQKPQNLALDHNELLNQLRNEAFYSHILTINLGERSEQAIVRALHRHPYKSAVLHMDLQRVSEDQQIRVHVPLHFINEATCPGVKNEGGAISHHLIEVEVSCLPKDLPEFIEVDVGSLSIGQAIHLSELKLSPGVSLAQFSPANDALVVNVHHVRVAVEPAPGEPAAGTAPTPAEPDSAA